MRFWVREVAGWVLVGLGLYLFMICLGMLLSPGGQGPMILEAGPVTVIGIVVFRGGIHLLKVAVAARVCMEAQAEMAGPRKPEKKTETPWDLS